MTQFKNTVLLLSSGPVVVTGLDFPAENYKSEHSVTDPELKVRREIEVDGVFYARKFTS